MTDLLAGRTALITGAGRGIGAEVAAQLGSLGARVLINDLVADRAVRQAIALVDAGIDASAAPFDVCDYAATVDAVVAVGAIDILVNNAGNAGGDSWTAMVPFVETAPADWEPYIGVNLYGVMHATRAVLPGMIERQWGRIVTIISDASRVGEPLMAAYGAAKAGAAGLTRAVANEVGRYGITANNISLGTMRTPLTEARWASLDDADPRQVRAQLAGYAVRRPGLPDDVAALVAYLVSPAASWMTGQTIPLNGGYSHAL